jgi:hypothetical protein
MPADGDPATVLTSLGEEYLTHLFSQQTANMFRVLIAESQRNPELARVFYEVGPARGTQLLRTYLEGAKDRGYLNPADCGLAAQQFLLLCKGMTHLQFLLNLIPSLTPEQIRLQTAQAVEAFMALYGPKTTA